MRENVSICSEIGYSYSHRVTAMALQAKSYRRTIHEPHLAKTIGCLAT